MTIEGKTVSRIRTRLVDFETPRLTPGQGVPDGWYDHRSGRRPLNFPLGGFSAEVKTGFILIARGDFHDAFQVGNEGMQVRPK